MRKGRVKGQTKRCFYIKDELLEPYKIQIDEYNHIVIDENEKPIGYFSDMGNALKSIMKTQEINSPETNTFTLKEYFQNLIKLQESFNKTLNQL